MNPIRLNTVHRYVGLAAAPFLVLQAVSGLILGLGPAHLLPDGWRAAAAAGSPAEPLLAVLHHGPGRIGEIYRILLAASLVWMAVSGWILYLRIRRARNRAASRPTA